MLSLFFLSLFSFLLPVVNCDYDDDDNYEGDDNDDNGYNGDDGDDDDDDWRPIMVVMNV